MKQWTYRLALAAAMLCQALSLAGARGAGADKTDKLYQAFVNPPSSARPDVYWWWNGNALSEKEILRELDTLKKAGIGGTLVFPMARTMEATKTDDKELEWLSPEWCRMVKVAAEGAKARGMNLDLLVGTGWPFGGPFLKSGEKIQMVQLGKKELTGPCTFKGQIKDLMQPPKGAYGETNNGSEPRLVFLRLIPATLHEFEPGIELKDKVKPDGSVEFEVPAGKYVLHTGTWKEGFMIVNIPAPGGGGSVLDHFSAAATQSYLKRFTDAMQPVMGEKIGRSLRSLHVDSFEFTGANWTDDFVKEFEKRRGYDLVPYLPLVLDWPGITGPSPAADAVQRVRHDYWLTMGELFDERFMTAFEKWCHQQGTGCRVEAYGCPTADQLDPKLHGDFPMGETWITIFKNNPRDETPIPVEASRTTDSLCIWSVMSNKYVSSGAHLKGRRVVGCETMTNDMSAFRTTLEQFKIASDMNFVSGINHPVWHGYNLNPPATGFPGWFYCGEFIDERNTWWPYFRQTNDYVARIASVLQSSDTHSEVAVIDNDSRHWVWEALHQAGYSADYVSERVLCDASFEGGKIHYGPNAYEALVINQSWAMELETAQAIKRLAQAGGRVIFIDRTPGTVHGLKDAQARDAQTRDTIAAAMKLAPERIAMVPGPKALPQIPVRTGPEKVTAARWAAETLARFGVTPGVALSEPHELLYQIHQRVDGRDIYFFANLDCTAPVRFTGRFDTGDKTAWRWDPETGKRVAYPHGARVNELKIDLEPKESLLLVFEPTRLVFEPTRLGFEPAMPGKPKAQPVLDEANGLAIDGPWEVRFAPAQEKPFTRTLAQLIDFSADPQLISFSGTATYRTSFEVKGKKPAVLDLGHVADISEVTLNGKPLGVRWWGKHRYEVAGALRPGRNTLEVKVTNTLSNYCRSLKDNPVTKIWVTDKNRQPLPAGLIGPVRLVAEKPAQKKAL